MAPLITLLTDSFDAARIESVAGAAPQNNVIQITVANDADIANSVRAIVETGAGVIDVRRRTADRPGRIDRARHEIAGCATGFPQAGV